MFTPLLQRRKPERSTNRSQPRCRTRLTLTTLEDRAVPYALAGTSWANLNVTYSLMPDGTPRTDGSSLTSSLFASMDALAPREVWQAEIDQAMQSWAAVSGLTFTRVADDGSPGGTSGAVQGDSRFGDVRIGAYPRDLGTLGYTWYPSTSTRGGDMELNSAFPYRIGGGLGAVVLHEAGHALGLAHSDVDGAVMQAVSGGSTLHPDDIAGIQALYGPDSGASLPPPTVPPPPPVVPPPPSADRYESNDSLGTARNFGTISGVSEAGLTVHTATDVDYFTFSVRRNGTYTISIAAASAGDLDLAVYGGQATLIATAASVTGNETVTVNLGGGQAYTVKVYSPAGQLNSYDLTVAKSGGKPGKGGYLRLDGPGADSSDTGVGTVSGLDAGAGAAVTSAPSPAADGAAEQSRDQVTPPVEFLPVERESGRPESPGRAADAPGIIRSQAMRLLLELDLPDRAWSEGPSWARAG